MCVSVCVCVCVGMCVCVCVCSLFTHRLLKKRLGKKLNYRCARVHGRLFVDVHTHTHAVHVCVCVCVHSLLITALAFGYGYQMCGRMYILDDFHILFMYIYI